MPVDTVQGCVPRRFRVNAEGELDAPRPSVWPCSGVLSPFCSPLAAALTRNPSAPAPRMAMIQWPAATTFAVSLVHNGKLGKCQPQQTTDAAYRRKEDANLALSDRQLLDSLSRMPFADSAEPEGASGEPHATIHRGLTGLLADGIVGRVSHGAAHQTSLELSDRASFDSIPLRKDGSQSYNSRAALLGTPIPFKEW